MPLHAADSMASLILVPGSIIDDRAVPHGELHALSYYSDTLKSERKVYVWTPPGYSHESDPLRCSISITASVIPGFPLLPKGVFRKSWITC